MLMDAKKAKEITQEAKKTREMAEAVNDRIRSAARLGYGYINASSLEIETLGEFLLDTGYRISGNYIIWYDEVEDNRKEEEDEEDEW